MEILVIWFCFAILTAYIAAQKGRDSFGWFAIGLLFGIFGLVAIICSKDLPPKSSK